MQQLDDYKIRFSSQRELLHNQLVMGWIGRQPFESPLGGEKIFRLKPEIRALAVDKWKLNVKSTDDLAEVESLLDQISLKQKITEE
jgi:hypothetical protein